MQFLKRDFFWLFLALLAVPARETLACSRPVNAIPAQAISVADAFANANDVFEGKILSAKQIPGTMEWETTFTVAERWKGSAGGPELKTLTTHNTCDPFPYTEGESGLFFYNRAAKKFYKPAVGAGAKAELNKLRSRKPSK